MSRARVVIGALSISAAAFVGLLQHEAYRPKAYYATPAEQAKGISTVGFGTTDGVKPGDTLAVEPALQRALSDVGRFEGAIKRCVTVPLHQHEYDAYASLAYNIGTGAFCGSTLVRRLNEGDYPGACAEISRWDKQGDQVLRGLTKRRADERARCEGRQ